MDALFSSIGAVFLAEIGDKTQLLALFLSLRFAQKHMIVLGIFLSCLINHLVSAYLGVWLAQWLHGPTLTWILGISFILIGLWLLKPDKAERPDDSQFHKYGVLLTTIILFFLAELGDKTQIATVILAAKFQVVTPVVLGTTIGMLLANAPVVYLGGWLMGKLPFKTIRIVACILFLLLGVCTLSSLLFR
ncbi:TMEM165/GDT1 family protein [Brackiella oedipodis]|uniref:TMEM165/GDT1 family protein n=1 Tax=Brackiella oedipodis TaxID=124225 RepID=UPI00048B0147|nr:TMEM165/GDT1 family protein [Brackiella oedipodis]